MDSDNGLRYKIHEPLVESGIPAVNGVDTPCLNNNYNMHRTFAHQSFIGDLAMAMGLSLCSLCSCDLTNIFPSTTVLDDTSFRFFLSCC